MHAKSAGQEEIPVHIFPFNYGKIVYTKLLANYSNLELKQFWYDLKVGYDYFQNNKLLPSISVDEKGKYIVK